MTIDGSFTLEPKGREDWADGEAPKVNVVSKEPRNRNFFGMNRKDVSTKPCFFLRREGKEEKEELPPQKKDKTLAFW